MVKVGRNTTLKRNVDDDVDDRGGTALVGYAEVERLRPNMLLQSWTW